MPLGAISLKSFGYESLGSVAYDLLRNISAAQQQLYYAVSKTERGKRRYSKEKLETALSQIVYDLIRAIPVEFRSECFEKATTIICKELK
jgi:hypothetical protein